MTTSGAITILGVMISFFLVATTSSRVVAGENELVLDIHGKPVKVNTPYYIYNEYVQRLGNPPRVGLSRFANYFGFPQKPCPQEVVYPGFGYIFGELPPPFVFGSSSDFVRVSTELNIGFVALPSRACNESQFWTVSSPSWQQYVVLAGSNDSTFIIKKSVNQSDSYSFAFGSADSSTDIGLLPGRTAGILRLTLDTEPYDFQFVPASAL